MTAMSLTLIAVLVVVIAVAVVYLANYLPPDLQQPIRIGVVLIAIIVLVMLMLRVSGVALP